VDRKQGGQRRCSDRSEAVRISPLLSSAVLVGPPTTNGAIPALPPGSTTKILLVDDDHELAELLADALSRAGFGVLRARDPAAAHQVLRDDPPELILLDVHPGPGNGFDLLRELRRGTDLPVIVLSAYDDEDNRVRGLELGADDYLAKPFSFRELIARIRARLRRRMKLSALATTDPLQQVGPLALNLAEHTATKNGRSLGLTVTEFRLLQLLMANAGTVLPTEIILKTIWGYDDRSASNVLRVMVHRLRNKIEDDPLSPRLLHTVRGIGVMLKPVAS